MFNSCSSIVCNDYDKLTFCISNDYNVYSFGNSQYGSNGHKDQQINIPTKINNLTNIKQIDCGDIHTICLNYDGEVFSFGNNRFGELGISKHKNELKQTHIPQKINIPPCIQVSCGGNYTICLTDDNKLYSFGKNDKGQLALGNNNEYYTSPQLIPDLNNIEYIVCGGNHSICKTYDNEYYCWGSNIYGELGQSHYNNYNKPIQCLTWPNNIINIKSGDKHSLLLTSEGQIYSFGCNFTGQLGINNSTIKKENIPRLIEDIPEIKRIQCGYKHSMCIDINNNLWIFGGNTFGQLGLQDRKHRIKPIQHPKLSNIIDISSRGEHTFVKTLENKIYAFGYNNHSQLGIKTSKNEKLTPIQVFQDNEDIWCSTMSRSRVKSARK